MNDDDVEPWDDFLDYRGEVDRHQQPPELSHYCDLTALHSILVNDALWASNIRFLNDKEEMDFGIEVAVELVEELAREKGLNPPHFESDEFKSYPIPDVYAVSFCESPDLLSMWRGYGLGSQSVSIQFDFRTLAQRVDTQELMLSNVAYGRPAALEELREYLSVRSALFTFGRTVDRNAVFELCPSFKNEHFKEEQEWRLIYANGTLDVLHRPKGNVLLPYVKIDRIRDAIYSITVGPGKDSELTKRSIEHFLQGRKELAHIQVHLSKIPYRT